MAEVDTHHLDTLLSAVQRLAPLIRDSADEAERQRRMAGPGDDPLLNYLL